MKIMTRTLTAQVALFAFAVALLAGLYAGNSPTTVLLRGLVTMGLALVVAQAAAGSVRLVLRDHVQRAKTLIDREHEEASREAQEAVTDDVSEAAAP